VTWSSMPMKQGHISEPILQVIDAGGSALSRCDKGTKMLTLVGFPPQP
jgi:hypothetical protein